jgi:hypothetical protein
MSAPFPSLGWLAPHCLAGAGLFSGDNEHDGSYVVYVKLKTWDEFDKYPRPRGSPYDDTWEVTVFVVRDCNHYSVNDIFYR